MDPTARLLAVVPAYNEESTVAGVVDALHEHAGMFDVLVIDDGSTDQTAAEAERAGATVVSLPFNVGIGGAVQTGFLYAERAGYDYMAQVDGDGQHDPAELPKLIDAMCDDPTIDMVCGSRFLTSELHYPAPLSRRTGIHLFAFALSRLIHQRVSDPTSGFRLYNRRAISLFSRDYPHDYPEVEAVLMIHTNRLRMVEIPVRMRPREGGRSSITRAKSLYYMVKVSLALLVALMRRSPVAETGGRAPLSAFRSS